MCPTETAVGAVEMQMIWGIPSAQCWSSGPLPSQVVPLDLALPYFVLVHHLLSVLNIQDVLLS